MSALPVVNKQAADALNLSVLKRMDNGVEEVCFLLTPTPTPTPTPQPRSQRFWDSCMPSLHAGYLICNEPHHDAYADLGDGRSRCSVQLRH